MEGVADPVVVQKRRRHRKKERMDSSVTAQVLRAAHIATAREGAKDRAKGAKEKDITTTITTGILLLPPLRRQGLVPDPVLDGGLVPMVAEEVAITAVEEAAITAIEEVVTKDQNGTILDPTRDLGP